MDELFRTGVESPGVLDNLALGLGLPVGVTGEVVFLPWQAAARRAAPRLAEAARNRRRVILLWPPSILNIIR